MKRTIFLFLFQAFCAAGLSENLRFTEPFATHIPARADLDVRWNAPTNAFPSRIWVYHLLPRQLSAQMISNLMTACSFTAKDESKSGNVLIFKSPDGHRQLRVSWPWGVIDYRTTSSRSPTNLINDVPGEKQAIKLTEEFLPQLGISLSDVEKEGKSSEPEFHVFDTGVTFFVGGKEVTNTEARAVRFARAVDGISFISIGTGGDGEIHYGDQGKISEISLTWRNMERDKSYSTFSPEIMVQLIREGKAIQGMIPDNVPTIDWRTVKSVTIKEAKPSYYAGGDRFSPSDTLSPFAALLTTVDTGQGTIDVEIDCPLIDETKP